MPLNPSGAISLAGPVAGQSIAVELGQSATATISLNDTNVRTLAQKPSGVIVMPTDFWGKSNITGTQKAIFGYGLVVGPSAQNVTNLVSNTGVVASNTPGVGTARFGLGAATYGGDKAIFAYGETGVSPAATSRSQGNRINLVSNTGVVASDTPGVGIAKTDISAAGYGGDKAIFAFGGPNTSTNLISNTGVMASDTPIVPGVTARRNGASASYGGDKAIFGYGYNIPFSTIFNLSNLVSNTGVVAANSPGVGTARPLLAAAGYGGDKAIFAFGNLSSGAGTNLSNLVSNTGVVASDTPGVGSGRSSLAGTNYGGDKAIFGYGYIFPGQVSMTNLVSNTGVVASDTPGVGTARYGLAAAGYSTT